MVNHPSAKGRYRAAFVTTDRAVLADSGEYTQSNNRDASYTRTALSKGRPLKRKRAYLHRTSWLSNNEPSNTAGLYLACEQSYIAKDYFYLYKEQAPV
jgi:hypothetical protein